MKRNEIRKQNDAPDSTKLRIIVDRSSVTGRKLAMAHGKELLISPDARKYVKSMLRNHQDVLWYHEESNIRYFIWNGKRVSFIVLTLRYITPDKSAADLSEGIKDVVIIEFDKIKDAVDYAIDFFKKPRSVSYQDYEYENEIFYGLSFDEIEKLKKIADYETLSSRMLKQKNAIKKNITKKDLRKIEYNGRRVIDFVRQSLNNNMLWKFVALNQIYENVKQKKKNAGKHLEFECPNPFCSNYEGGIMQSKDTYIACSHCEEIIWMLDTFAPELGIWIPGLDKTYL